MRRRHAAVLGVAVAAAAALAPTASGATGPTALRPRAVLGTAARGATKPRGPLSGRLATLAQPSVHREPPAERARRLSLPAGGPGSLVQLGSDVVVDVRVAGTSRAQLRALRAAGARVISVVPAYDVVSVAVAPARLSDLARVAGVKGLRADLRPMTSGLGDTSVSTCPAGTAVSEADAQMNAAAARAVHGVDGRNVTVGVISDSFNRASAPATTASEDVASGDLPGPGNTCGNTTPVNVVAEATSGDDEGRAMLQTVHDLAPGARLAFATALPSSANFLAAVPALRAAGAKVIADDVTFFDEPYFQDGPESVAAADAVAHGVAYYSSAANNNFIQGGADRASWEAPSFRAMGCPPLPIAGYTSCMNFGTAASRGNEQPFVVNPGRDLGLNLQWAEPWGGVRTDLDAFLVNDAGTVLRFSDDDNVGGTQQPFEFFSYHNGTGSAQRVWLIVANFGGTTGPRLKWTMVQPIFQIQSVVASVAPGDLTGPSIFGHNGLAGGMSVAAVPFNDAAPFNIVQPYSSRGPVTHYFGPVTGSTPARALASPRVLAKPDVAATDCGQTTFFAPPASGGVFRFCGTSEAAPQAAAVAALEMQAAPAATVEQVMNVQKATATPVVGFAPAAQGAGMVNALAAVNAIKTVRSAPSAVTGAASAVTRSTATVTGSVNPEGFTISYGFQYGRTAAYGATTPAASPGVGVAAVPVAAAIGGLAPGTTYHYRLIAIRQGAIVAAGADRTFTTAAPPPPVVTPTLRASAARRQHVRKRRVVVTVSCTPACRATVTARIKIRHRRGSIKLKTVRVNVAAGARRQVRLKLSRRVVATIRKALRRHRRVTVAVTVTLRSGTTTKKVRRTVVLVR